MEKIYGILNKTVDVIKELKGHWLLVCIIAGAIVIILITLYLLTKIIKKSKQKKSNKAEKETKDENAPVSEDIDLKPADLQVKDEEITIPQEPTDLQVKGEETTTPQEPDDLQVNDEEITIPQEPDDLQVKDEEITTPQEPADLQVKDEETTTPQEPDDLQVKDEETKAPKKAAEQKLDINYDSIIRKIIRKRKKYKCILFASADTESLPVTIPTNVAVGLAKNKKLCLLIDLDVARDAVAEAFGIEGKVNKLHQKAIRTKFENLWVLPGHNFVQHKQMNIKSIVQSALDRFDLVLINAPDLVVNVDRNQIISAANTAVICSKDTQDEPLKKMLKTAKYKVLQYIRTGQ